MKKCFLVMVLSFAAFGLSAQNNDNIPYVGDSLRHVIKTYIDETPIYAKKQLEIDEQSVRNTLDAMPAFAVYKDIFFVTGVPLNKSITNNTADVMFNISIRQRLSKSYFPFSSFLYLTYSQKSFWDIYASSSPFRDTNYNPGLGFGRYIIHDNKLAGAGFVQIEHESNGKDGKDSRSWNYISLSGKYYFNLRLSLNLRLWIPFVDGSENQNLLNYRGLGLVSANYISRDTKWWLSTELNPRKGWGNVNTTFSVAFKMSQAQNQYLFARFYNGKGDSLLDYNKYEMNVRVGICIKPDFFSVY